MCRLIRLFAVRTCQRVPYAGHQLNLPHLDDTVTCNLNLHKLTTVHSIRVKPSLTSVEIILRDVCGITEQNKKQVVSLNPANTLRRNNVV